jgi:hypothetical protein
MADELNNGVGRWYAFVAGPAIGWDMTVLGIAIYNSEGDLVYSRFTDIEKAVARGDWDRKWVNLELSAPPNWEEMTKILESFGNAMSQVRWAGGHATLVWDAKTGDDLFKTIVGDEKWWEQFAAKSADPTDDLVEQIARTIEVQPLMSDLTLAMGDSEYHQALAEKIRKRFVSEDARLTRSRIEADTYMTMINEILEAMCERQGVSTASPYDPDKRAPNFVLMRRLGIGRVIDMPDSPDELDVSPLQIWSEDWNSPEDETNLA